MKIALLRHGKPDTDASRKMSSLDYGAWVSEYNLATIDKNCLPSADAVRLARQCDYVVCSDLARSVDSATLLGVTKINVVDPVFREFGMPYSHWQFPKFSPSVWSVFYRLLWVAGYSSNAESFQDAKIRTVECMTKLTNYASINQTVLFVGHGLMLWYLTKLLRASGWHGPKASPRKYWDYGVYSF